MIINIKRNLYFIVNILNYNQIQIYNSNKSDNIIIKIKPSFLSINYYYNWVRFQKKYLDSKNISDKYNKSSCLYSLIANNLMLSEIVKNQWIFSVYFFEKDNLVTINFSKPKKWNGFWYSSQWVRYNFSIKKMKLEIEHYSIVDTWI